MFFDIGANVGNWTKANLHITCKTVIRIYLSRMMMNFMILI